MPGVLIVEDSRALRVLLAEALQRAGYAVTEATNGAAGIACIARQVPDAVIVDLWLPVVDGMAMLKRMREQPAWRGIPVIVLTGDHRKATIMEAAKLGVSAYLLKARFVPESLLEALARVCKDGPSEVKAAS